MEYTLYSNGTGISGAARAAAAAVSGSGVSGESLPLPEATGGRSSPAGRYRLLFALVNALVEQSEQSTISWNRFGRIALYCCSMYGVTCLFMALLINRTLVIASVNNIRVQQNNARGGLGIGIGGSTRSFWKRATSLLLRLAMISSLLYQLFNVLVAFNVMKHLGGGEQISSLLQLIPDSLFAYDVDYFSHSRYMSTPSTEVMVGPTTDMNWPIFLNFCGSVFVETFLSVLSGVKPFTETGITIFEHSLAFQEFSGGAGVFLSRFRDSSGRRGLHQRPSEQLLVVTFLSILAHLNVHVGAITNSNRFRLIPSTILGVSQLFYFSLNVFRGHIFDFPLILIVTIAPQVSIIAVILLCLAIFGIAVLFSGNAEDLNYASFLSPPGESGGIDWENDFYSGLISMGTLAVSSAGKSSYIKEVSLVVMGGSTWVEQNSTGQNSGISSKSGSGYANFIHTPPVGQSEGPPQSSMARHYLAARLLALNSLELAFTLVKNKFKSVRNSTAPKDIPQFLQKYIGDAATGTIDKSAVCIDNISEEDLEENYLAILGSGELTEQDSSANYKFEVSDSEVDEEDDETEEVMGELFNGSEFLELVNAAAVSGISVLHHHMEGRITRSRYREIEGKDEGAKLAEVIVQQRESHDAEGSDHPQFDCVICQCNVREIITWPCKCFAICEPCRLTLVARGIEGCVCCRREVEGVSKVFIP